MPATQQADIFMSTPLDDRKARSHSYILENPTKVPVVLINNHKGIDLEKYKYLLPREFSVKKLVSMVKKVNACRPEEALYFYANGKIVRYDWIIGDAYDLYKHEDGFLYLKMTNMPTFGKA